MFCCGPVIVVLPLGTTDSTPPASVTCWMMNCDVTWLPVDSSVARSSPICVGVAAATAMMTRASPLASLTTVCVAACGEPGLVVCSVNCPCTTSKRTERPDSGMPPAPVTRTDATLVWPEHTSPPEQGAAFGVMVSDAGSRTAGRTVTSAVAVWPLVSRMVTFAVCAVSTLLASSVSVLPLTFCGTGSAAGFAENAV
ncbi:MAG: hypothetical protein KJ018_08850 [Burkholderiales bacterium]|nr:hypothetical protein [Burkholderiales bacterium]